MSYLFAAWMGFCLGMTVIGLCIMPKKLEKGER